MADIGRPKKNEKDKVQPNGLTVAQNERIAEEAEKLGLYAQQYLRKIVNWHFATKDQKRKEREVASEQIATEVN